MGQATSITNFVATVNKDTGHLCQVPTSKITIPIGTIIAFAGNIIPDDYVEFTFWHYNGIGIKIASVPLSTTPQPRVGLTENFLP